MDKVVVFCGSSGLNEEFVKALLVFQAGGMLWMLKEPRVLGKELSRFIRKQLSTDKPDYEFLDRCIALKVELYGR